MVVTDSCIFTEPSLYWYFTGLIILIASINTLKKKILLEVAYSSEYLRATVFIRQGTEHVMNSPHNSKASQTSCVVHTLFATSPIHFSCSKQWVQIHPI